MVLQIKIVGLRTFKNCLEMIFRKQSLSGCCAGVKSLFVSKSKIKFLLIITFFFLMKYAL